MRRLTILGSTGSIGTSALQVVDNLAGEFRIVNLTANRNAALLIEQARRYRPEQVAVVDDAAARIVEKELRGSGIVVLTGTAGLLEVAARTDVDLLLNGLVGSAGMEPTLAALGGGVDVALSNKESLVMAGSIIERLRRQTGAAIYPVDSEHSAIWQCLAGENMDDVRRLILTGSGGPFRTRAPETFATITPAEALRHPNWTMGKKITIDSATMMNKGLEVIEAFWLFGLPADRIDIVIHPESIIHSLVEFADGSVKAQLGRPDMRVPIQYALTYPRHRPAGWENLDLIRQGKLTFEAPDREKFPCLRLAYAALEQGGTAPAVLNVANEQAVYRFLREEISFSAIPDLIERALSLHEWLEQPELEDIRRLECWCEKFINE
ncbi:MAG: 1-deoxy-D-xylulose-5-phosphate reductoisomerase [Candidatus Neomarinimicrobiota bacterium]